MNNNLNLDLMKNDTSRNNIIPLNEDLDEYNATKNKNIKNKQILKITKDRNKHNFISNEPVNINIDKNNTIFHEINNGKYDNIAKLFTTELLNSLTNEQIEFLKYKIEQIYINNYIIYLNVIEQIKSNITPEEDEQIKSQINNLKHKDFSKHSKKYYTYYRYKEELVNACKTKYSEIFANINNMEKVRTNPLAHLFINAYIVRNTLIIMEKFMIFKKRMNFIVYQ